MHKRLAAVPRAAWLLGGLLAATDVCIWLAQAISFWPVTVLAGVGIFAVPGMALLRAMRLKPATSIETVTYTVGMSVLILLLSGLLANQLLPLLGVVRPLDFFGVFGTWNVVVLGIVVAGAFTNQAIIRASLHPALPLLQRYWRLGVMAALLPVVAAAGAFRLNNGGDALVACAALLYAALLIGYLFIARKGVDDNALAWCIFMLALSVLLMTSLRSWDISGHDFAREFRVYTMTHNAGIWDISQYRDPYNACLSITILPEALARLLNVSGLFIFKFVLQAVFALCVVVVFCMLRHHVSSRAAMAGCILFISYPTFINDSAMLTRQGVAYLFFSLALLTAMDQRRIAVHRWLFLLCGLGVVLSHYSTSYMFVAIFGVALLGKLVVQRMRGWRVDLRGTSFTVLTPLIFVTLAFATFMWYSQFTATSKGLITTIGSSVANMPRLLSDENKSSDTSAALFMAAHKSQADIYDAYLMEPTFGGPTARPILNQYVPQLTSDDIAVTPLGNTLRTVGSKPSVTNDLRQQFAKILQLVAAVSVIYVTYLSLFHPTYLFSRRKPSTLPIDLISLSLAGIVLLILMVVLPNLSLNYGVLRTFQQSLIFLVIPLCASLVLLGRLLRPRLRSYVAAGGMVGLFLLFSGFFAQVFGGVGAPLTLNNYGLYYGLYYTTRADLAGYAWMKAQLPADSDVRSSSFARAVMHDPDYPFEKLGILPGQVDAKSYVFLDQAQVVAQKFYVYQDGSPLITTFPMNFYQEQKNQIYSTPTTAVYH